MTDPTLKIVKPSFSEKFKSKNAPSIAGVETLLTALPIHKIGDANDWTRLHPSVDDYWTGEMCFVSVPVKGAKRDLLHLIEDDLAVKYLPSKKILRHRLALACKPHDVFFFCIVPSQNLDNPWNKTALEACDKAQTHWIQALSRKAEGVEGYKIEFARNQDAFPPPKWTTRTLDRWDALGTGPPRTRMGRTVLYRRSSVQKWLAAQENQAGIVSVADGADRRPAAARACAGR